MLETGGVLETYRLDVPPARLAEQACIATRIHDHRLRFLTYQGSVNKGLGRVKLVDSGTYRMWEDGVVFYRLEFDGNILKGVFSLTRAKGDTWKLAPLRNSPSS